MLALTLLFLLVPSPVSSTFRAEIAEFNGSGVSGTVVTFEDGHAIGFGGFLTGLEANLDAANCTALNGCGVQIHSGLSCESTDLHGGHFFPSSTDDPWVDIRYSSDANGDSSFAGYILSNATDLLGRAFLVHAEDGSRVGCGLLEEISDGETLFVQTNALLDNSVFGISEAVVYPLDNGRLCFMGMATGLQPNLVSFLEEGPDCTDTNGCGVHIHAGFNCTDASTQLGHLYNNITFSEDPWARVGYLATDSTGFAHYVDCLETGETQYDGRTFVVHANDGSRISCGLLERSGDMEPTSSPAPVLMKDPIKSTILSFKAEISELEKSGVSGTVVSFTDGAVIGFGGVLSGLQPNLEAATCNATNGCGVHVHAGFSCASAELQGGHYHSDEVTDPWVDIRYSSDDTGIAEFSGYIVNRDSDLSGRAFVVHAEDGSRVGCGLLVDIVDGTRLSTRTNPLTDDEDFGQSDVVVVALDDRVCFMGSATGLEPNLFSYLQSGEDCQAANGCGAHIHSGFDCSNTTTQEGHLYDTEVFSEDPWARVGYLTTDDDGFAYYVDCLQTGETEFDGRAFILHSNNGSRVSCGLLARDLTRDAPSEAPVSPPSSWSKGGGAGHLLTLVLLIASSVDFS